MTEETRRKLSLKHGNDTDGTPRLQERLHKVLAQAGLGSRRALEQRIADGLVKVNGEVAQVGVSIGSGDKVEIDGRQFVASALTEPSRVLMYNKPEGEVTTREDPEGRATIFDALPALKGARWIAIGRLDINTTGLLLLTTDGELANAMMHPSHEVEREYVCRVRAPEGEDKVSDKLVDRLQRGVAVNSNIIKALEEREWIRVVGHRDVPGKPELLATTKGFLDYFGLKRLDELPPLSELKDIGELEPQLQFDGAPMPLGDIASDATDAPGDNADGDIDPDHADDTSTDDRRDDDAGLSSTDESQDESNDTALAEDGDSTGAMHD
jgi:pseudouridine synthase